MPTLEINGRDVEVDDSFLQLSPEQQNATVDEIALSLSREGPGGRRMDPGHSNVPEFVPPGVEGYNPQTGTVEQPAMGGLGTFMTAGAEGVPIIGGMLDKAALGISAGIGSAVTDKSFGQVQREMAEMRDRGREQNPGARFAGNVTGGVVSMAPLAATGLGARALGLKGSSFGGRTAASGLSSSGIAGADTLARGGSLEDARKNALVAGGVGAFIPGIGRALNQAGSSAARAAAPSVDALRQTSRNLYQQGLQSGRGGEAPGV